MNYIDVINFFLNYSVQIASIASTLIVGRLAYKINKRQIKQGINKHYVDSFKCLNAMFYKLHIFMENNELSELSKKNRKSYLKEVQYCCSELTVALLNASLLLDNEIIDYIKEVLSKVSKFNTILKDDYTSNKSTINNCCLNLREFLSKEINLYLQINNNVSNSELIKKYKKFIVTK